MALIAGAMQPLSVGPSGAAQGVASPGARVSPGVTAGLAAAGGGGAGAGGYRPIGGTNPFSVTSGANAGYGAGLGPQYGSQYADAFKFSNQQYGNQMAGWEGVRQTQARQLAAVGRGYGDLWGDVQGTIAGTDAAAKQQIADTYAQQQGAATQGLAAAGLGNSTVTSAVSRGLTLDQEKAYTNLADQMAQLSAGYQSQIGLAGLGFRGQSVLANSQLAQNQLQWMNSVQAQYPDPALYAHMQDAASAAAQNAADRKLVAQRYGGVGTPAAAGGGLGYSPTRNTGPYGTGGGGGGGGVPEDKIDNGTHGLPGQFTPGYYAMLMKGAGAQGGMVPGWGPTGTGALTSNPGAYGYNSFDNSGFNPNEPNAGLPYGDANPGDGSVPTEGPGIYDNWGETGIGWDGGAAYGGGGEY